MIAPSLTISDALDAYLASRWLSAQTVEQYRVAIDTFNQWHGSPVPLAVLSPALVTSFMREYAKGRSPRTVNGKRQVILTVWRHAKIPFDFRDIPRAKEIRRVPTAWSMEDLAKLLSECDRARLWHRRHRLVWTPNHWRALALTIYDCSLRIGCLLTVPRSAFDPARRTLLIPGEHQKQRADTFQSLHSDTCEVLSKLPPHDMLFPWPMCQEQIWVWWGRILKRAGLPATRRDKFHRLRRTSYSHVKHKLGTEAATKHAGHAGDLSAFYYDPTIFDDAPNPLSVLPRP